MTTSERPPILYEGDDSVSVNGLSMRYGFPFPADRRSDELLLMKTREMIDMYGSLVDETLAKNIVEFGIMRGGSVALLAALAQPTRHVAFELSETPLQFLNAALERHGLAESTSTYYGIDQGDAAIVGSLLDAEFGDTPLDLVIDDASHLYGPSLESFNVTFPRLRPGGRYVIEDWAHEHDLAVALTDRLATAEGEALESHISMVTGLLRQGLSDEDASRLVGTFHDHPTGDTLIRCSRERAAIVGSRPLSSVGLQLAIAVAESPGAIASVSFNRYWIDIIRGNDVLDASSFTLESLVDDSFGLIGHE